MKGLIMKTHTNFKSLTSIIVLMLIACLFTACSSSIKVTTDYDKGTDFSTYKTFMFVKEVADIPMNDLNKNRLLTTIEKELNAKGLVKSDEPDIIVDIQLSTRQEQSATTHSSYYGGYGRRGYGRGGGFGTSYTSIDTYVVGTVIINLVDNKENTLVWQGVGEGTIDFDAKNREAMMEKNIAKILYGYPPVVEKK